MRPYYERGGITIYHGDALDLLASLKDESVDLVATDPPYFRVKDDEWDRKWKDEANFLAWIGQLCDEWRRVLRPNGSLYVLASTYMGARVEAVVSDRFCVLNNIRWKKGESWAEGSSKGSMRAYFPASETIIFAEQRGSDLLADDASGYTKAVRDLAVKVFQIGPLCAEWGVTRADIASVIVEDYKNIESAKAQASNWILGKNIPNPVDFARLQRLIPIKGRYEDLRQEYEDLRQEYEDLRRPFTLTKHVPYTDTWEFETVGAYQGKHPCEKPLKMMEHIITASSRPGDVVLDNFIGSGTTLEAAKRTGRQAIGGDEDEAWCRWAADRLSQGFLFGHEAA